MINKDNDDKWNNLHKDLLIAIAESSDFPRNIKFSAVSKSWKSATYISKVPLPKAQYLLLAEVTGAAPMIDDDEEEEKQDDSSDDDVDDDDNDDSSDEENHNDHVDGDEDINYEVHGEGNHEVVNEVYGDHEVANVVHDQGLYNIDEVVSSNNERNKGDKVIS